MMPVDTSMYEQKGTPFNPLKSASEGIAIGNAMQQNKLLQTQNQTAEVGLDKDKTTLAMQKYKAYQDFFAPMAADPDLTDKKIIDGAIKGVRDGLFTSEVAANELSQLPRTPQERQAWARDHQIRALTAMEQIQATIGAPSTINVGDNQYQGMTRGVLNPAGAGGFQADTQATTGLSPEANASGVEILDEKNQKVRVPLSSVVDRTGHAPAAGGAGDGAADPVEKALLDSVGGEQVPVGGSINPPAAKSTTPAGALVTGLPAGFDQRLKDSQMRVAAVRDEATPAAANAAVMDKIYNLSKNGVKTGNTAALWNDLKNTLAANGVSTDKMTSDAATFSELQKYMAQAVQGGGAKSDEQLGQLMKATPNDKMLPQTLQNVTRFLLANVHGKIIKQNAMNKSIGNGQDPEKEEKFKEKWDKVYDPRAVELTLLSHDERDDYLHKLGKDGAEKVIKSYKELRQLGAFGDK